MPGVQLETSPLVLTAGRDFRWKYDNLGDDNEPANFPAGDLFYELHTYGQQNALQRVIVDAASGGTYKFSLDGHPTADIDYYDVTVAPHSLGGDVQSAIAALPNVGTGNVIVHPAQLIPVWYLSLTLNAGHNEVQKITFRANGGTFVLSHGANFTGPIAYVGVNGVAGTVTASNIQSALEGLASIGSGNVSVTLDTVNNDGFLVEFINGKGNTNVLPIIGWGLGIGFILTGDIFPNKITTSTIISGSARISEPLLNTLNQAIDDFFNGFNQLPAGVNVDVVIYDDQNLFATVTSKTAFEEDALITFAIDVTDAAVEAFFNGVSSYLGGFDTVHVDFYWKHTYLVEFVGALANKPLPALIPNTTSLTGLDSRQSVTVTVLQPGKEEFTRWPFSISGSTATIKVESEVAALIQPRTQWQLVFLPSGEAAGGDPIDMGRVQIQQGQK